MATDDLSTPFTRALECLTLADRDEPAWRLQYLAEAARHVDAAMADAVAEMRASGASWARVGDALGLTRQAAQQRYGAA